MALLHHPDQRQAYGVARGRAVEDRRTVRSGETWNAALRGVGAFAGGVALVYGLIALFRIDWNGLDSSPVEVAGLSFTPIVAIATAGLGVLALLAGAAADRTSKLVIGAFLACVGIAVPVAGDGRADWDLESGHGWLALLVGGVLVVTGLAMRRSWSVSRQVREELRS